MSTPSAVLPGAASGDTHWAAAVAGNQAAHAASCAGAEAGAPLVCAGAWGHRQQSVGDLRAAEHVLLLARLGSQSVNTQATTKADDFAFRDCWL